MTTDAHAMQRGVVAVDGVDGSGKSHVAGRLRDEAARRGVRAVLFRVDDFRRPVAWQQPGRTPAEIYYDDYYDLAALERALVAFRGGAAATSVPVWDPVTERVTDTREQPLDGVALAIVEGVFTLRLPSVADGGFLVFLRTSPGAAEQRIVERDQRKGRTREQVLARVHERYLPAHAMYLARCAPESRADAVIDNEDYAAPRAVRMRTERLPAALRGAIESLA
jgi:uridine kinase